ncbi:cobalamin-dependent protein [Oscillospiraceae bacterium CM]|nr:cobalamin-dependent protein [Oscillospiraceae bacterium CM]
MIDINKLQTAMGDLEEDIVVDMAQEIMANGGAGAAEAVEACKAGMETVGSRFESGDYFVSDLIYAGDILTKAIKIMAPALSSGGGEKTGRVILCTVKADLHDIGKNIVKAQLESSGFEVLDLGIDVPPEVIVKTAKEENIDIIALSGVLTLALDSMKATVDAFKAAGMRDKVKIIIGGAPVTEQACIGTGADEWAINPQKTVSVCTAWSKK